MPLYVVWGRTGYAESHEDYMIQEDSNTEGE